MTKKEFAKQVFQMVFDAIEDDKEHEEIQDDLEIFLDALEPRDREQFAKWGHPKDQADPKKCWV